MSVYHKILNASKQGNTLIAQLLDPDHIRDFDHLVDISKIAEASKIDLFFFGGSLITNAKNWNILDALKKISKIPVVLFPSSPSHIQKEADAILFLSLISGRNAEFLIGNHVTAAPILKNTEIEVLPTGYMLISCGNQTTAEYISNTTPIPFNKPEIAGATALAGEMLGLKLFYLDGGSGAEKTVSPHMVREVKKWITSPVIVGGGVKTTEDAVKLSEAGADVIVIGNAAEKNPALISELYDKMK